MENLDRIQAEVIKEMLSDRKIEIEGKIIQDEALEAIHDAISSGCDVIIFSCQIKGSLNFTTQQPVPLSGIPDIRNGARILNPKRRMELGQKDFQNIDWIQGIVEIQNSTITGNVQPRRVFFTAVNFSGTRFMGDASFEGAIFGDEGATFWGAEFFQKANFIDANFGDGASFGAVTFRNGADFIRTIFREGTTFEGTTFVGWSRFWGTSFGKWTNFWDSEFFARADFNGASFEEGVSFETTSFGEDALFIGSTFGGSTTFDKTNFIKKAVFNGANIQGSALFRGDKDKLLFHDEFDFRAVRMDKPNEVIFHHVSLAKARFLETPIEKVQFINVEDFWPRREGLKCVYDEIAEEPKDKDYALIARTYRQLKRNFEEQRAYPEAGAPWAKATPAATSRADNGARRLICHR